MPNIYSKRRGSVPYPEGAIYVGRPTEWGNPFPAASESQRNSACDQFEAYAVARHAREPWWLLPLKGKHLVCWCKSTPTSLVRCHAETLLRLANS
jgi:hypothetical protein